MVKRSRLKKTKGRKKPVRLRKVYAKEVYSMDLGYTIDRTTQPHPLGLFDVDFRDPKAKNPQGRKWTYGWSKKSLEGARKTFKELNAISPTMEIRVVKSDTGEVLE